MHELSICRSLLRQVREIAESHGSTVVRGITLRVGPLAGVEPSLLKAAYLAARRDTIAADAELAVETTAVQVRCLACDAESEPSAGTLACAVCGSTETVLRRGDECTLVSLDLVRIGER